MTTATIQPGMNLPCLSPNPKLWWYDVTALPNGNLSAMSFGDPERVTDEWAHVAIFPTWSQGTISFVPVPEGETCKVIATSDSDLLVTFSDGREVALSEQILVLVHGGLDLAAVQEWYAQ